MISRTGRWMGPRTWLLGVVWVAACGSGGTNPSRDAAIGADATVAEDGGPPVVDGHSDDGRTIEGDGAADRSVGDGAGDVAGEAAPGMDAAPDVSADAGPPTLSAAEFPAVVAKAFCGTLGSCCPGKPATGCESVVTGEITALLADGAAAKNVFDPVNAAACVAAVRALGNRVQCVPWFMSGEPSLLPCNQTLDGTIAPGQECGAVAECRRGPANGTRNGGSVGCAQLGGTGPKRCRAFVPTTTPGTTCEMGFHGVEPEVHVCAGGLQCVGQQCVAYPGAGQPCPDHACDAGLYCSAAATCEALAPLGASCVSAFCQAGLDCDPTMMKCVAPAPTPWILSVGFWATSYACE
jgi:hypothetical protein